MIAIISQYRKCDATYTAIAAANFFEMTGRRYTFMYYDWRSNRVNDYYDAKVKEINFHNLLGKVKYIVWSSFVDPYFVDRARRKGIVNILIVSNDVLSVEGLESLKNYHYILLPNNRMFFHLRDNCGLTNLLVTPYRAPLPVSRQSFPRQPDKITLFLSLESNQAKKTVAKVIEGVLKILLEREDVVINVPICNMLTTSVLTLLKYHVKQTKRVMLLKNLTWEEQILKMANSDLTVWPAVYDENASIGIASQTVGTPVICWKQSHYLELISPTAALMIDCNLEYNQLGESTVIVNNKFIKGLKKLINNKQTIKEMTSYTTGKLNEQRDIFTNTLNAIIPLI